MQFFEPLVFRPLAAAVDIKYDSPAYNARKKGTNIKRSLDTEYQICLIL